MKLPMNVLASAIGLVLGLPLSPTHASMGGGGAWTPARWFLASEQGIWLDPSDFSTMFQDSAGTTPVTAVEQPVGKILDKSGRGNHATQATTAQKPVLSARKNLLLATTTLATQNVTTVATPYTLSHTGTGTITLSGTSTAGPLVGAGTLTFTPTAGTLTMTVSGTVSNAQLEYGSTATTYQRVTTNTDYDTVGFPHYLKFDGVDDGVGFGTFPAGTLGTNMDCFMLVRLDSTAVMPLVYGGGNQLYAFCAGETTANGTVIDAGAGAAQYLVNGVPIASTRQAFTAAAGIGRFVVVEAHNMNLSGFTQFRLGNYPSFQANVAYGEIILAPAQSAEERTEMRKYLAAKAGITLP